MTSISSELSALDVFGGREAFARQIWAALASAGEPPTVLQSVLAGMDPVVQLQKASREAVLGDLNARGLGLDEVMTPAPQQWDAEAKERWRTLMAARGGLSMRASNGAEPDYDLALEVFVRMEALDEFFPASDWADAIGTANLNELRKQFVPPEL